MSQPRRAADLLRGILRDARPDAAHARLQAALDAILGEPNTTHCKVQGFRGGRLYIQVDSAPLFAELRGFRTEEIRQGLNEKLTNHGVAEVIFRMGGTGHV